MYIYIYTILHMFSQYDKYDLNLISKTVRMGDFLTKFRKGYKTNLSISIHM